MKFFFKIAILASVSFGAVMFATAQVPPPPANQLLSDAQLDQLLGPIALYPDPLIAEILPAATFPTQVVLADRYLARGGDPNQINQQPWDASVQAVARYPEVLKWMDDNLGETVELGQAFLNQQQGVMASIQRLRATASKLGNLQSTPQQQVTDDNGNIEINPTDDQELYVPVYQADQVYSDSAGDSPYITFGPGCPIGDWLDNDFDWGGGTIIVWNTGYRRPDHWWHHPWGERNRDHTTAWHRSDHPGAGGVGRGDRGWANAPSPQVMRQEQARQAFPREGQAATVSRMAPAPMEHAVPTYRPEYNGAFMGIPNTRDTRTYSDRGQQSMRAIAPSAPVFHSAPSGGGGGGHFGGGGGGGGHAGGGGGGFGGGGHR